tara:strand:- start:8032 stop:8325 length:294 start_codon:yes stop_codon:yes gene_type:complete
MILRNINTPYRFRFEGGISEEEFKNTLEKIATEVNEEYGDSGSCVLGFEMIVEGSRLCSQPWQGSVSCGAFYNKAGDYLVSLGIHQGDIHIEYGRMD